MLTAVAATILVGSWLVGASSDSRAADQSQPRDTKLTEQPLVGLGAGVTVREVAQGTPFSLVAVTGDLTDTSTRVRAKRPDGSWGPWYQTEYETASPDPTSPARGQAQAEAPRGTAPVFVGTTTTVQIAVTRPLNAAAPQAPQTPQALPASRGGLGYRPASRDQPMAQNLSAVLISPPQAPPHREWTPPTEIVLPGQPPTIISRADWGADESQRCPNLRYNNSVRAAVIHHTAGSNDYSPLESASIVRGIYSYHTRTLGWCDIAYNALVDKYGQVFEGAAGGLNKPVQGTHTGGFNRNTWGVSMIGDFQDVPPTPIQLRTVARLIGWRLGLDGVDPKGVVQLQSAGGRYTTVAAGTVATLPTIFTHRDVSNTDCPGNAAYALLDEIRDIAAHTNDPPEELLRALQGGAIYDHWESIGGMNSPLGAPTTPEGTGEGDARYVTFIRGAMYWSPDTGAQPIGGALYDAWAAQDYERGPLGLPTSAEIQEPLRVTQNFQHGTLNFDRLTGTVTTVIAGVTTPPSAQQPEVRAAGVERFSRPAQPGA